MAADQPEQTAPAGKRGLLPVLLGLGLALLLGGAGFYVTWSGLLSPDDDAETLGPLPDIAFVPVDPVIISLPQTASSTHLRFTSQLEVAARHKSEVAMLLPRIIDVLNGYLRAIDVAQIEDPTALVRIRAQLLRRIQLVAGEGRVRDLLITEFVLN